MKYATLLLLVLASILAQAEGSIPSKEDLCGLIVDSVRKELCLDCFTKAGDIRKHPHKVRKCVGKHLPPKVAECSVPHPDRRLTGPARMQHGPSHLHHNHTNANLLPNCLRRRMRDMSRYLRLENRFAWQAGNAVKAVVLSKLIRGGGSTMLGIWAQKAIFAIPEVQAMVNADASSCLTEFEEESKRSEAQRLRILSSDEDDDEDDQKYLLGYEDIDQEDDDDDLEALFRYDDYDREDDEYNEIQRGNPPAHGNNLPFSGTNSLARHILLGQCIVRNLIDHGAGLELLKILRDDEFFYPIPHWWLEPLLRFYKSRDSTYGSARGSGHHAGHAAGKDVKI